MEMAEVLPRRRTELGMSQVELAAAAGVDRRQIRRYEAGEQQPVLSVAVALANALKITVGELAGIPTHRIDLSGEWWASWQTSKDGEELITLQEVRFRQEAELIDVETVTRGISVEEGGLPLARGATPLGQRDPDGLVRGPGWRRPVEGNHVLRAAPARPTDVGPPGRPQL